jgi:hypothetical protein
MKYLVIALVLVLAKSAFGLEKKAYQMREDFGNEPLYDCALQYYYYIPCPTYSWFWAFTGWAVGDIIGEYFVIGDQGTGGYDPCDPATCHELEIIRILDFAGYGTVYPGLFTVEFDVWCPPCPLYHLWNSGPVETGFAWNYIYVEPPLCLTPCYDQPFMVVVTANHTGTDGIYPAWGMDNISTAIETGCELHDYGCMPATFPRNCWADCMPGLTGICVHSGYFGNGDPCQYDPPLWFCDGRDTTPDCSQFGPLELAWRIYLICAGPTANETSTWGNIKTMYR